MEVSYELETFQTNGMPAGNEHDRYCVTYLKRYEYPSGVIPQMVRGA
jgi:hypothetical protein